MLKQWFCTALLIVHVGTISGQIMGSFLARAMMAETPKRSVHSALSSGLQLLHFGMDVAIPHPSLGSCLSCLHVQKSQSVVIVCLRLKPLLSGCSVYLSTCSPVPALTVCAFIYCQPAQYDSAAPASVHLYGNVCTQHISSASNDIACKHIYSTGINIKLEASSCVMQLFGEKLHIQ